MYSKDLFKAVTQFFEEEEWKFSPDEEKGIIKSGMMLRNKLKSCNLLVIVSEDELQSVATIDISADQAVLADVAEFITRANYGLKYGKFEMDYRDGEIRYQMALDCGGDYLPDKEKLERLITVPIVMFSRYGDALLSVLFGFSTPEEAIEVVEG